MRSLWFNSRGQVAILYTIALPVLIAFLALCTDVAVMYTNWQHLQRAADAAALAGAGYLPNDVAAAVAAAEQYASSNDTLSSEMVGTPTVAPDDLSITVKLKRTVPYYLARVLGLVNQDVQVSSTAGVTPDTNGTSGLMPIGLDCEPTATPPCDPNNFSTAGTQFQVKLSQTGPGNWAPLALGGNGANTYRNNLRNGYTGTLDISQPVWTEPGNIVGPTGQAITDRLAAGQAVDPGATPCGSQYDPRYVVMPIIQYSGANGKTPLMIQNFANVWINGLQNNNNAIDVTYCGMSDPPSSTALSSENFGMLDPVLLM
jgi:Flp pilus assembly protein TadG